LDATQLAVVTGPRTPSAGNTGEPRARRHGARCGRRDSHTGPAVVQETAVRRRKRRSEQPADRFQPFAAVAVRRRSVRHVRLSHRAAGHVPRRVQNAAERADQDAADVRHAQAVQRVAGFVHAGPRQPSRRRRPGAADVCFVRRGGGVFVRQDHPEVHTQEQKPSDVRLPVGR